jgi:hypothetical protein
MACAFGTNLRTPLLDRGISAKRLTAILDSWRTDYGSEYLCTGPYTWNPMGAFDRLGKYGWGPARVNEEVTNALFQYYEFEVVELIKQAIDDLEEEARVEWEEEHAPESTGAKKSEPADV